MDIDWTIALFDEGLTMRIERDEPGGVCRSTAAR
jgi:hypothetical protein